ncbi:unnamed protein product [Lepeophtheirus salmonis]|uniref:(salmon louse) hypothetical protein n=1 Tax=Lepeophtheirus salmonis TaxID=72036 RepID=A0A817F7X2_LEPSM|nr:unnamed protein product [Lepeophtheirus salmonis]CAG9474878.1 unnamed protein product [Lepeophtheirus salmonis]
MGNIQHSKISEDYVLTTKSDDNRTLQAEYNQNLAECFLDKITKYLEVNEDKELLVNCGKRFFPDETVSDGPVAHTLKDFLHKVPALAKSLYEKGLRKSDVVHLIIGNRADIYLPVFATILCQGVINDVKHFGVVKLFEVLKKVPMYSALISANFLVDMAKMIKKNGEIESSPNFDKVYFFSPVGAHTYAGIEEDLGILFKNLICVPNFYGSTESGGGFLVSTNQHSNGGVVARTETYIRDLNTGQHLGPNKIGELMFRKANATSTGYLNRSEENEKMFEKDGWTHTGDFFHYTEQGEFFFHSRINEMIKCQGSHVYPIELEGLLKAMHDDIIEVGVVPVVEKKQTVLGAIIVVKNDKKINVETIRKELNKKVDEYKRIEGQLLLTKEPLPRNAMGKLLRSEIQKLFKSSLA